MADGSVVARVFRIGDDPARVGLMPPRAIAKERRTADQVNADGGGGRARQCLVREQV
jgi:hypothetical protein